MEFMGLPPVVPQVAIMEFMGQLSVVASLLIMEFMDLPPGLLQTGPGISNLATSTSRTNWG
jgi:hypothetical protein